MKIIIDMYLFKGGESTEDSDGEVGQENFAIGVKEEEGGYLATTDDGVEYKEIPCFTAKDRMVECDSFAIDGDIDWEGQLAELIIMYKQQEKLEKLKLKIERKKVDRYYLKKKWRI